MMEAMLRFRLNYRENAMRRFFALFSGSPGLKECTGGRSGATVMAARKILPIHLGGSRRWKRSSSGICGEEGKKAAMSLRSCSLRTKLLHPPGGISQKLMPPGGCNSFVLREQDLKDKTVASAGRHQPEAVDPMTPAAERADAARRFSARRSA